jgi:hypothetical protein
VSALEQTLLRARAVGFYDIRTQALVDVGGVVLSLRRTALAHDWRNVLELSRSPALVSALQTLGTCSSVHSGDGTAAATAAGKQFAFTASPEIESDYQLVANALSVEVEAFVEEAERRMVLPMLFEDLGAAIASVDEDKLFAALEAVQRYHLLHGDGSHGGLGDDGDDSSGMQGVDVASPYASEELLAAVVHRAEVATRLRDRIVEVRCALDAAAEARDVQRLESCLHRAADAGVRAEDDTVRRAAATLAALLELRAVADGAVHRRDASAARLVLSRMSELYHWQASGSEGRPKDADAEAKQDAGVARLSQALMPADAMAQLLAVAGVDAAVTSESSVRVSDVLLRPAIAQSPAP